MLLHSLSLALAAALVAGPAPAAPPLDWQDCAGHPDARCTTLRLPVDRADPAAGTFGMAVAKVPATDPAHRIGVLVVNPGGPGGSGVAFAEAAAQVFPAEVRARFDIVGFDPRGIQGSQPVVCSNELGGRLGEDLPRDQAEFAALAQRNQALRDDCRARNGALFDHLDTHAVVDDIDDLRVALGEEKLSFYGASYGTLMGQQYAQYHGEHLRAAVLDGNMDHSLDLTEFAASGAAAAEDSLAQFADWCSSAPDCAWHGGLAQWRDLLAAADRNELYEGTSAISAEYVIQRAYSALGRVEWAELGKFLATLRIGNPAASPASAPASGGDETIPLGRYGVLCEDWDFAVRDYAELARVTAEEAAAAPSMRYSSEVRQGWLSCVGWRGKVTNPPAPARVAPGTPKLLLTNSKHDAMTGYAWAEGVHRQLPDDTVLLSYAGSGHTAYRRGECMTTTVDAYLLDLRLPRPGTVCE